MSVNRRTAVLVGLITVVLAGCGDSSADPTASSSTGSTPEASAAFEVGGAALAGVVFDVRRDPG